VPRQLLDAAEAQRIQLFTSRALIAELGKVLSREKLAGQLSRTRFTAAYLLAYSDTYLLARDNKWPYHVSSTISSMRYFLSKRAGSTP
jgi:predicted nucleic acid-binding protein